MKVLCASTRTTNANIRQLSSLSLCLQITNSPVRMKFLMTDDGGRTEPIA